MITPQRGLWLVDGLITGWHEPEASHLEMLEAAAGRSCSRAPTTRRSTAGTCGTSSATATSCCPEAALPEAGAKRPYRDAPQPAGLVQLEERGRQQRDR